MGYKSFAVVGLGGVGEPVTKDLLAKGASVIVLSRPGSSPKAPEGVEVVSVDYSDVSAVATIFKKHKVEVVISSVGGPGLGSQEALVDASKEAGVQLFVPSEFGAPTVGHTESLLGTKENLANYAAEIGVPTSRVFTGLFIEWVPWLFRVEDTGKINLTGEGTAHATFTSLTDITGFIAHVYTTLPNEKLQNSIFRIQGDQATLLEAAAHIKGKELVHVASTGDPYPDAVQTLVNNGLARTGYDHRTPSATEEEVRALSGSSNSLWEGHQWKKLKDVLG